jgi:hypothetical protein
MKAQVISSSETAMITSATFIFTSMVSLVFMVFPH